MERVWFAATPGRKSEELRSFDDVRGPGIPPGAQRQGLSEADTESSEGESLTHWEPEIPPLRLSFRPFPQPLHQPPKAYLARLAKGSHTFPPEPA